MCSSEEAGPRLMAQVGENPIGNQEYPCIQGWPVYVIKRIVRMNEFENESLTWMLEGMIHRNKWLT